MDVNEYTSPNFEEFITVKADDISEQMPTHMLAVWSKPRGTSPLQSCPVSLHPTHNIILAAHCEHLVAFARTQLVAQPHTPGAEITIPVQGLCVPHRESFAVIHQFLYTKDSTTFFGSLVPRSSARTLAPAPPSKSVPEFALRLANTFSTQVLLAHVLFVSGVYANMCCLGIQDDEMWRVLCIAWDVIKEALVIATNKSAQA